MKTSEQIRKEIRDLWPNVVLLQLPDEQYFIPSIEDVIDQTKHFEFGAGMPSWWDCNHYALEAYAYMQSNNISSGAPWAFGMCFGTKFNRFPMKHTCNICYSDSGIWFIDVQSHKHWKANKDHDTILTVTM